MHADDTIRTIAATQHGLITRRQVGAAGLSTWGLRHRLERGDLARITANVMGIRGAPDTASRRLLAHVLDAGAAAALSHTTALAHWGVRGFVPDPVHVTRHRDDADHELPGAIVHEVRDLPLDQVRLLDQIPVVSPALALLQLAGMRSCRVGRLARAIDAAWSDRLVSYTSLTSIAEQMSRQGRRGLRVFRELVEERGPGYVPPASNLEARVDEISRRDGRPAMRRQVNSGDGARWIGRVDFRDAELPLVLEVQSERFHRGLTAERDDAKRLGALRRAGYEVVEVTDVDVFHRPHVVLERLDAARARLLARKAA